MTNDITYTAKFVKDFTNFLSTDKDAILIVKNDGLATSLYEDDEINDFEYYYIRVKYAFIKAKYMDIKYDNENKNIIVSLLDSYDIDERDDIYDSNGYNYNPEDCQYNIDSLDTK